jgi:hypothetical protein
MKYRLSIICSLIVLLVGGCSSTGGNVNHDWDDFVYNSGFKQSHVYQGYAPDFSIYQETRLSDVQNSFITSKESFDGYYFSKEVVVVGRDFSAGGSATGLITVCYPEDVENRENDALGFWTPANRYFLNCDFGLGSTIQAELKPLTVVTVWYRGLYRYSSERPISRMFLDKYEITGQYEMTPNAYDIARAEREAERQQPRFSPEGKEYVKRTLPQAVGEANNSANRGKTLFFETSSVALKEGVTTGQWFVTELLGSNSPTIMYYYDRVPPTFFGYTILYRVEISNIGVIRYTIDSFRQ